MRSSGWKQFRAHFGKNLLEKRRNTRTTICELTCHLVIVLIMLFGYGRTTTRDIPTTDYSVWNTTIPPSFVDSKTNQVDLLSAADYIDTLLTEPLPIPTFNTFLDAGNQLRATGIGGGTTSELLSLTGLGRRLDNLQYEGSICFAPRGPLVDSLLSYLNRTVPALNPNNNPYRIKVFDSEDEAVDYQQKYPRRRMFALIVLHQIRPDRVNYEIRMPYYLVPNTNRVISRNAIGLSSRYREYLYSGFLSTQDAIDKWVFEYTGAVPATNTTVDAAYVDLYQNTSYASVYARQEDPRCVKPEAWVMPFPVQEFNNNPFYNQVGYMLGLGLCMAYMYPLSRIVKASVEEKETKMREVMKIMGLGDTAHQLSWLLLNSLIFTWIGWSTFALTTGSFIKRSDKLLIFLFFWLFSMSLVTFAMLLSVFFSNSKLSSIVAPVMLYAMLLPRYIFFYTNDEELEVPKFLFSMLSPTAFAFGADAIASYEYGNVGIQTDNIDDGAFSFLDVLSMLAFDVILYGVLALYLDRVLPQEVGTPLPWNFFLHWHYWFPKIIDDDENHADEEGQSASTNNTQKEKSLRFARTMKEFQPLDPERVGDNDVERINVKNIDGAKVCIGNLRKKYPDGKVAVKHISLAMMEGEITCLLGANGAGKSTTIGVLTGLVDKTGGRVEIYGNNIDRHLQTIRGITGICPQQNVLVPSLTVSEHLHIFGRIKGVSDTTLHQEVIQIITDVGLFEKKDVLSDALSGGMKRKLCLAIALIGDPKFVLLDEPTSGMDPYSRRSTWELLMRYKKGRVIVLTTHFMEEADTLGDRIAIMSEGALRCSGSSLFLKSRYGAGYVLSMVRNKDSVSLSDEGATLVKAPDFANGEESATASTVIVPKNDLESILDKTPQDKATDDTLVTTGGAKLLREVIYDDQVRQIEKLVRSVVPDSYATSAVAGEILFHLPLHSTANFGALFSLLKEQSSTLGVGGYGISITTLEQVFIRLAIESKMKSAKRAAKRERRLAGEEFDDSDDSDVDEDDEPESVHRLIYQIYQRFMIFSNRLFCGDSLPLPTTEESSIPMMPLGTSDLSIDIADFQEEEKESATYDEKLTAELDENGFLPRLKPLASPEKKNPRSVSNSSPPPSALEGHPVEDDFDSYADTKESVHEVEVRDGKEEKLVEVEQEEDAIEEKEASASVFIQFKELLKKRKITCLRDLKGAFFQIVFPSLQILLVLAILQLSWSPAGKTLKLQSHAIAGALKGVNPAVVVAQPAQSFYGPALMRMDGDGMKTMTAHPAVNTSNDLSQYLLEVAQMSKEDFPQPARYAGYAFNDSITFNITVDWKWVRNNTEFILENQALIGGLLSTVGVDVNSSANSLLNTGNVSIPFTLPNVTYQFLNGSAPIAEDFLSTNIDFTPAQENVLANVTEAVLDAVDSQPNDSVQITGDLMAEQITYNLVNNTVTFVDAELYIAPPVNDTFLVGNVTVSIEDVLVALAPNETISYPFNVASPFSLIQNTTSPHSLAIFNAALVSSAFAQCSPVRADVGGAKRPVYLVKNHPLPVSIQRALEIKIVLSILASLFILVPLCYIPASFVPFLVKERISKSKHLQIVSGVSPITYWIATYVWDMALFTFLTMFCMFAFWIMGGDGEDSVFTSSWESTAAVFLMIWLYGFSAVPLTYFYSMAFENPSTAQISITTFNFTTGFVGLLAVLIMSSLEETEELSFVLRDVFRAFPGFLIGEGFLGLAAAFFSNLLTNRDSVSYFSWNVTGRTLTYMGYEAVGYFGLVLFLETMLWKRIRFWFQRLKSQALGFWVLREEMKSAVYDDDVAAEMELLENANPNDYALFVKNLHKIYPPGLFCGKMKYAVKNVSFACPVGERFGLLGINGAGKTTTLGVLTGDLSETAGDMCIAGLPLNDPRTKKLVGFCPQVDPLLESLNGYETLWFFGRVRGIPEDVLSKRIDNLIDMVGLTKHASRPCGTYSGGNKRKLSLCVAMVGDPKVLFLDEPSTGMDPEARRSMWDAIETVSSSRSIVLVSHSMEECEALCTRIGIMVSGRMQCLGSTQHIKSRFGATYLIEIRCEEEEHIDEVVSVLSEKIGEITIEEQHGAFVGLKASSNMDLSVAFDVIEQNKASLHILDYSVSQATLEQIFIEFAKKGSDEREKDDEQDQPLSL